MVDPETVGFREWVEQNPLRVWRKAQTPPVPIMETAAQLAVSMSLIQMWEAGSHLPNEQNLQHLEQLIGSEATEGWSAWHRAKPAVGSGSDGR